MVRIGDKMPIKIEVRDATEEEIQLVRSRIKRAGRSRKYPTETREVMERVSQGVPTTLEVTGDSEEWWHRSEAYALSMVLRAMFIRDEVPVNTANDRSSDDMTKVVVVPREREKKPSWITRLFSRR